MIGDLFARIPRPKENPHNVPVITVIGTVVFLLTVALAFWLGFQRLEPDLRIEQRIALSSSPRVRFDPSSDTWQHVVAADPETGQGPQYASLAANGEDVCAFTWQVGAVTGSSIDLDRFDNDADATAEVMRVGGLKSQAEGSTQVVIDADHTTAELLYFPQGYQDGVYTATAARVFAGSGDYVLLTLLCADEEDTSLEGMSELLTDVLVRIYPTP